MRRCDSINDGGDGGVRRWPVGHNQPGGWVLIDFPASYLGGSGGLSFVDGHSEIHKVAGYRETTPPLGRLQQLNVPSPNNPDAYWVMETFHSQTIDSSSFGLRGFGLRISLSAPFLQQAVSGCSPSRLPRNETRSRMAMRTFCGSPFGRRPSSASSHSSPLSSPLRMARY
jgi:hypothetical protein